MSGRREICLRKEITLSQQKVGESPRMEESRREGCIVGRKGSVDDEQGECYGSNEGEQYKRERERGRDVEYAENERGDKGLIDSRVLNF